MNWKALCKTWIGIFLETFLGWKSTRPPKYWPLATTKTWQSIKLCSWYILRRSDLQTWWQMELSMLLFSNKTLLQTHARFWILWVGRNRAGDWREEKERRPNKSPKSVYLDGEGRSSSKEERKSGRSRCHDRAVNMVKNKNTKKMSNLDVGLT